MQKALKDIPIEERAIPSGIISVEGDYYYAENPPGLGISSLAPPPVKTQEENTADH